MRIPSGVTDQYIYFVAVDDTTGARKTGLSSFTVYRSRDGGAAAAYTTPTVNETDSTNMPGVYELLLDEDMTIGSGNDSEEVCLHITKSGMLPVTRTFELYRREVTAGETLTVSSGSGNAAVQSIANNAITAASINSGAITSAKFAAGAIDATAIANGAIDAATFAADVDAEILSYLVDDATRIDASALNTLSGHDPGETIMGATDLGTGSGLTSLATQASVDVIDGIVDAILVDTAEIGAAGAGLTEAGGTGDHLTAIVLPSGGLANVTAWTVDITGNITGNLSGSVGSVTGAINTAAGTITTLDALDTAQDSQHSTTQTATTAIKAKTDSLTFTVAGQVDANIQYVNDVQVTGTGASGDEWGP